MSMDMEKELNDRFVQSVKQHVPPNDKLVNTLMEILSLGKEAVYRRLRSQICFTFFEMVKVSQRFGFSLDHLIESSTAMSKTKWAVLDADALLKSSPDYLEQYIARVDVVMEILQEMKNAKTAKIRCATNSIPYTFLMSYENLSRFSLYKWAYLTQSVKPDFLFSKMVKPLNLLSLEKKIIDTQHQIPRNIFIIDRNFISFTITDINYFYDRKLVSPEEYQLLKKELYNMVSFVEDLAAKGIYDTGGEVSIYLSDVSLDSTYMHFEYDDHAYSLHRIYFVDTLNFKNSKICQKQGNWIELLKRYSTQITQSGEAARFEFFNKQRKLIKELM